MGQHLYIEFEYGVDRKAPSEEELKWEAKAWQDDDEMYDDTYWSDNENEQDDEHIGARKKYRLVKAGVSLGSGDAWKCYVRAFAIAYYKSIADKSIQGRITELVPIWYDYYNSHCINVEKIRELKPDDTLHWIKELFNLESLSYWGTQQTHAVNIRNLIFILQQIVPHLPLQEEDLHGTPYMMDMNGDTCDDRWEVLVHYFSKALRYEATICI